MIAEARRRAREANLPVRFTVANLFDLPYPEHAFDYLLLSYFGYSVLFLRRRRIRFLRQAHSVLKPGGLFIVSVATASHAPRRLRLFGVLSRFAPFNREYEAGNAISGGFMHSFQEDDLRQEFEEAKFIIKDWLWDKGYAVLVKPA
jgi:ubiquinone/menaquinone biosynthesis C-methylase UbiE